MGNHCPVPAVARRTGRPRHEIINAIFYVLCSGCPWRMLPDSFAPVSTVYSWFVRLRDSGVFATIRDDLLMRGREPTGRDAGPSAAVIDAQSRARAAKADV